MPKDIICNAHYCAFYGQPVHRIDRHMPPRDSRGRLQDPGPTDWPPTDEQLESWENRKFIVKRQTNK